MNAADEFFKLARPDLEAVRRIELLDDEPTRAFSRLSALIDPVLHAELKGEAARKKVTMGELIEPVLRARVTQQVDAPVTTFRSRVTASLLKITPIWAAVAVGYLLGKV